MCALIACSDKTEHPSLFTNVAREANVTFANNLTFTEELNPYTYRNFYNGAGVALGDINNDGLLDIYLTGNQVDNKLYLNKGNLQFDDITNKAGVACSGVWSAGVTMADVNADGWLDIYVCKSGSPGGDHRHNELFINNGDLTFTERSKEYGLDITGLSVQASFFDYDKDGDLDCYLLTNSIRSIGQYDLASGLREIPDASGGGNKFLVYDNGKYHDYSAEAGIYRSNIGFGLGITLHDFNGDSWTDVFVSNDFFERDYLYINDQHGGFVESLPSYFESISMGSMGADMADLDADGRPELFVTEMLPDSLKRKKTKTVYESWDRHQLGLANGYHHQFSRNVLQKNLGDGRFIEVGRLAGVAATEWSWGSLLFDMNNDGLRDIFVANGIFKDLLDRDYLAYTGNADNIRKMMREEKDVVMKLIDLMPSSTFSNYAFINQGELRFENKSEELGLGEPMFSSGSAYGDLDNDGDLDLVVNNINAAATVFRNNTNTGLYKSINLQLSDSGKNTMAVGTVAEVFVSGTRYVADNFVTRGFQSNSQPGIVIGLGQKVSKVDSIHIRWPDHGFTRLYNIPTDKVLHISKSESIIEENPAGANPKQESPRLILAKEGQSLFRHEGSGLVDFDRDRLLPMMYGNETPKLAAADVDRDGIPEVYVGGGRNQSGALISFAGSLPRARRIDALEPWRISEETACHWFDADGDGDLDFYFAAGGRFFPKTSSALADKLLLNNNGNLNELPGALPFKNFISTSAVRSVDFDKDGDLDLVVGERFDPFAYGLGGRAYLLENDGSGKFSDATSQYANELENVGMVTDVEIADFDSDGWMDVVVAGDWMPVTIFRNEQGKYRNVTNDWNMDKTRGWWHDIEVTDLNNDGRPDILAANHGLNSFFKEGDRMYVSDFDQNGFVEQIFCTKVDGHYYPTADRDEFVSQLPAMKKQLLFYKAYGSKSIEQLFPAEVLAKATIREVDLLASVYFLGIPGGFKKMDLPIEAQFAPLYALCIADLDGDGVQDLLAGGNQFGVKPQFGRQDASYGWYFKGANVHGQFTFAKGECLNVQGEIRDIEFLVSNKNKYIIFSKYEGDLEIFKMDWRAGDGSPARHGL